MLYFLENIHSFSMLIVITYFTARILFIACLEFPP